MGSIISLLLSSANAKLYTLILATSLSLTIKNVPDMGPSNRGACSAVMISENLALSAAHCVKKDTKFVWAKTPDGKSLKMTFVKKDPLKDLLLIRVVNPVPGQKWARLGSLPHKTDPVYAVSNMNGMNSSWHQGFVSNLIYEDFQHVIVHTAPILGGASGSGLFNAKGELIGINTMKMGAISFAVSLEDIREFLAEYRSELYE